MNESKKQINKNGPTRMKVEKCLKMIPHECKSEKMNKNGPKMIKIKYLEVKKVIQMITDVVQCEKLNFDYQKECEMYI